MTAFYKNNKIDQGEIQGAAQGLIQEPTFEVSADQAPDASFTSAGKSSGESKGIVSMMTMIKEDLEDEIANGVKSEEETQAKFEEAMGNANKLLDDLRAKKMNLEQAISDTNTEIDESEVVKEDTQGLLKEEKDYLASIKPDCDWILNSFTERREKRAIELEGLLEAKGMLAGASPSVAVGRRSTAGGVQERPRDAPGGDGQALQAGAGQPPGGLSPRTGDPARLHRPLPRAVRGRQRGPAHRGVLLDPVALRPDLGGPEDGGGALLAGALRRRGPAGRLARRAVLPLAARDPRRLAVRVDGDSAREPAEHGPLPATDTGHPQVLAADAWMVLTERPQRPGAVLGHQQLPQRGTDHSAQEERHSAAGARQRPGLRDRERRLRGRRAKARRSRAVAAAACAAGGRRGALQGAQGEGCGDERVQGGGAPPDRPGAEVCGPEGGHCELQAQGRRDA